MKKYWYYITIGTCPICGRTIQTRERMFTKKPKDYNKRHHFYDYYDWCDV